LEIESSKYIYDFIKEAKLEILWEWQKLLGKKNAWYFPVKVSNSLYNVIRFDKRSWYIMYEYDKWEEFYLENPNKKLLDILCRVNNDDKENL